MEKAGSILKRYGIKPVKSLGQNFLADNRITGRIVDEALVDKDDCVIEIGAGIGNLTMRLAEKAGMVIAVEIDKKLIPVLEDVLRNFTNTVIISGDILDMDLSELISRYGRGTRKTKIVANLPYYITTPVIMKILEEDPGIDSMVVMVQKEVADRLAAAPGSKNYGALTVAVGYYTKPRKVINVPPGCFIPPPGVYSTVVRMDLKDKPTVNVADKDNFFKTVKAAFGQRRKNITNALYKSGSFSLDKEEIARRLVKAGIEPGCRAEELSIVQFAHLSHSLFEGKG